MYRWNLNTSFKIEERLSPLGESYLVLGDFRHLNILGEPRIVLISDKSLSFDSILRFLLVASTIVENNFLELSDSAYYWILKHYDFVLVPLSIGSVDIKSESRKEQYYFTNKRS